MSNKDLVVNFIEAMRLSDVETLRTMITDDFSWWIAGKQEYLQTAGEHDKEFQRFSLECKAEIIALGPYHTADFILPAIA